jgi:hypothetical protein
LTILNCFQFLTNISRTHTIVQTANITLCSILSQLQFNQVAKLSLTLCNPQLRRCVITSHKSTEHRWFRNWLLQRSSLYSDPVLSYILSRKECVATRCVSVELTLSPHHPMSPRDGSTSPFVRIFAQSSFPSSGLNYAIAPHPTALTSIGNPLPQAVFRTSRAIEHKVPLGAKLRQNNSLLILSAIWDTWLVHSSSEISWTHSAINQITQG